MHVFTRIARRRSARAGRSRRAFAAVARRPHPTWSALSTSTTTPPAPTRSPRFDRHADGTLTPLPGSPFATGGAGTGAGIGSQGALQITSRRPLPARRRRRQQPDLGAAHQPDGGSAAAGGGPVCSGGIEPVSIAVHGNLVYVANAGAGGSNYTGFTLNPGGHLRPLAGSTFALPDGSSARGRAVQRRRHQARRHARRHLADRQLHRRPRRPADGGRRLAVRRAGPRARSAASSARPIRTQLFVSNAHGGAGTGTVSAFSDGATGR